MKKAALTALMFLLPASAAFASINVGDTSIYDMDTDIHGSVLKGEYVVTVSAIDRANDTITTKVRVKFVGPDSTHTITTKLSDFERAAATRAERIQNCAKHGGVPETLTTPAGVFNTCKMSVDTDNVTGFQWLAEVPTGYVKYVSKNGDTVTTQVLREFHVGH